MLQGLSTLPPRRLAHRGRYVYEFDLDAALARRPALILVDELAHSNAPGSRHPKRWQDVDELLEAGIDVFTTVNVQHLESLNDVVSGITGVQVRETVPDPFFDAADDVVLVDLPLTICASGSMRAKSTSAAGRARYRKLFPQGQSDCAARAGPCAAPPTASMSRCAPGATAGARKSLAHPRCDPTLYWAQHRQRKAGARRRPARRPPGQRLACGVCRDPFPAPAAGRPAAGYSRRAASGPELGAETATLSDPSEEKAVLHYAREHNLGKIVIGRQSKRRWWDRSGFADRLARHAPDLDLVVIALDEKPFPLAARASDSRPALEKWRLQLQGCAVAVALCAIITLVAMQWLMAFEAANLVMLYLLGVVLIALVYGRWPSVLATVINVISFDLFFVAPRGTLAVSDVQYLLTFGVMLTVGLLIGNLTAGVRYQARVARYRERRTRHLYEMSKALAVGRSQQDIATTSERFIASTFQARSQLLLPDAQGKLLPLTHQPG